MSFMHAVRDHLDQADQKYRCSYWRETNDPTDDFTHRPGKLEYVAAALLASAAASAFTMAYVAGIDRARQLVPPNFGTLPSMVNANEFLTYAAYGAMGGAALGSIGGLYIALRPINEKQLNQRDLGSRSVDFGLASICAVVGSVALVSGAFLLHKYTDVAEYTYTLNGSRTLGGAMGAITFGAPTLLTFSLMPYSRTTTESVYPEVTAAAY